MFTVLKCYLLVLCLTPEQLLSQAKGASSPPRGSVSCLRFSEARRLHFPRSTIIGGSHAAHRAGFARSRSALGRHTEWHQKLRSKLRAQLIAVGGRSGIIKLPSKSFRMRA